MTCAFDCRCQACRIEHFTRPTPELDAWLRDPATTADPRDMTIAYLRAEVARLTALLPTAEEPSLCQACWKRPVGGSRSGKRCAWCADYGVPLRDDPRDAKGGE